MARQKQIILSGALANLIFYESWGKAHVRTKPVKVRQTKATKTSARKFGKAVRISRVLREGVSPILPDYKNRKLMHRVNDVIMQTVSDQFPWDVSLMNGFEFYDDRSFAGEFKVSLSIEWTKKNVIIHIPEFIPIKDIIAQRTTKTVQLKLAATGCGLKDMTLTDSHSTTIDIAYNKEKVPAQKVIFPFITKSNSLSIVAGILKNGVNKENTTSAKPGRQWNPAGIIGAYCG